jgi:sialic acid synthase SpsE
MTKIIAEIGWNHIGNLNLAKKMILSAKQNGADMVKIQTFSEKQLRPGPWDKDGRRELYKKASLSLRDHITLYKYSKEKKIIFFSSVFNIQGASLLSKVQTDFVKIPSAEIRNLELIKFCNKKFKKILVSTGTSTFNEIKKIINIIPKKKLEILHCVSIYPLKPENANLSKIIKLKKITKNVGYSDHTKGIMTALSALKYNITYLEKHFTVSHDLPGRDNKFAILPEELNYLRKFIDNDKVANKYLGKNFQEEEREVRNKYSGRWLKK